MQTNVGNQSCLPRTSADIIFSPVRGAGLTTLVFRNLASEVVWSKNRTDLKSLLLNKDGLRQQTYRPGLQYKRPESRRPTERTPVIQLISGIPTLRQYTTRGRVPAAPVASFKSVQGS